SRRRHTRLQGDWSSDVCSSDLAGVASSETGLPSKKASEQSLGEPPQLMPAGVDTTVPVPLPVRVTVTTVRRRKLARALTLPFGRSEERRVGKECRGRWAAQRLK